MRFCWNKGWMIMLTLLILFMIFMRTLINRTFVLILNLILWIVVKNLKIRYLNKAINSYYSNSLIFTLKLMSPTTYPN